MSQRSDPQRVLVRLITHDGLLEYGAVVLVDDGNHIVVQAEFAGTAPHDLGFVVLELGDIWTEHYWRDRWYSVKAISTASGVFKGWYCDAARPVEVDGEELVSVDLELDLWVAPDRAVITRLDEDEFHALGLPEQDPFAAAAAMHAIDELERLATSGEAPFDVPLPPT
jgi:predicted RNA-binding protein associated with RNAse of E/G family